LIKTTNIMVSFNANPVIIIGVVEIVGYIIVKGVNIVKKKFRHNN